MIPNIMPPAKVKVYTDNQTENPSADRPYIAIEPSIAALLSGCVLVFDGFKLDSSSITNVQNLECEVNALIVRTIGNGNIELAQEILATSIKKIARDLVVYWVRDFGFLPIIVSGPVR